MTSPGDEFKAAIGFDKLDDAVALSLAAGQHLWVIPVVYGLTDEEAAAATEGVTLLLDRDHLLAISEVGCYICERPYADAAGQNCGIA